MSDRAEYIRENYSLEETADGWRAENRYKGKVISAFEHKDKAEVIRRARCYWCHFNFGTEAEAFAEIFPPASSYNTRGY